MTTPAAANVPMHLGRYIVKSFSRGYFMGKVVAWNNPYYRVVFSDCDEEDYTEDELLEYMGAYNRLGAQEGLIAEQQPVDDDDHDVAVWWLRATDFLFQLVNAAEVLEAFGNQ
jgi:hypothetical protein